MDLNRCTRCGNFYLSDGNVCPKCVSKDNAEFSSFKAYISENGLTNNLDSISAEIGVSSKNLNRFLGYQELQNEINKLDESNKFNET